MKNSTIVCPECHHVNTNTQESMACTACNEDLDHPFAVEVTDESAKVHIEENDIAVLVDFYSTTCGPCMAMYEDYEDAALGFGSTVRFLKINADKHQQIAQDYGVGALPTIIAFKKCKEVSRVSKQLSLVELTMLAESLV